MKVERNQVRQTWAWVTVVIVLAGGLAFWFGQNRATAQQPTSPKPQVAASTDPYVVAGSPIEAGRYIVKMGGCNDCHTPGYAMTNGQIPESDWLMGEKLGFRGPWGTTYAPNLRLFVENLAENDFVMIVRNRNSRPPMPWPSLHAMSDRDLRAVYAFLKSLPTKGERSPDYVPPGEEPKTPYFSWEPIMPKAMKAPQEK